MRYLVAATGERDACCLTVPITDRLNTRVRGEIADDIVNVRVCGGVGVYPRVEQKRIVFIKGYYRSSGQGFRSDFEKGCGVSAGGVRDHGLFCGNPQD